MGLPIWVLGDGYGVADLSFGWRWQCFVDELFWVCVAALWFW